MGSCCCLSMRACMRKSAVVFSVSDKNIREDADCIFLFISRLFLSTILFILFSILRVWVTILFIVQLI